MTATGVPPAVAAVHALLDADTEGEVVETLTAYLTKDDPYDVEGKPHADSLALLFGVMTEGQVRSLYPLVGLCIEHGCDVEICADDERSCVDTGR